LHQPERRSGHDRLVYTGTHKGPEKEELPVRGPFRHSRQEWCLRLIGAVVLATFLPIRLQGQTQDPGVVVDRFIEAFNSGEIEKLAPLFSKNAAAYRFDFGSLSFSKIDWIDFPGGYFKITYMYEGMRTEIAVVDRTVSGGFVTQRERWQELQDRSQWSWVTLTTYKIREGVIRAVWYFPEEPNEKYAPSVARPAYARGNGPLVYIDAGHFNMHTADGSYWPLAELLRRDGYRVRTWEGPFTASGLSEGNILVISNAEVGPREGPGEEATRSAFNNEEIRIVRNWVERGGAVLLVADHEPWGAAARKMAEAFGVEFHNGDAEDTPRQSPDIFQRADGTLAVHRITDGRSPEERIETVGTFMGQAFPKGDLEPLLVMRKSMVLVEPKPGEGPENAKSRRPVGGWLQAGVRQLGKGRLAFFGEAAVLRILTAEADPRVASLQNGQFALNLMHWLSGLLPQK
jgi:hypothetical protein